MNLPADLILENVSVVLAAEQHNPSLLNPDFLKNNNLVDRNAEVREALTTPAFSQIVFANGVTWTVEPYRCIVQKDVHGQVGNEYHIHQPARRYLEQLPHIPYRAVGLNWVFWKSIGSPEQWLNQRFMKDNFVAGQEVSPADLASLTFQLPQADSRCTLTIAATTRPMEKIAGTGEAGIVAERGIRVSFNFHFDIQGLEQAKEKINCWLEKQTEMETIAACYLGSADT